MKSKKAVLAGVVASTLVSVSTWAWFGGSSDVQYRTAAVEPGEIDVTVSATGNPNAVVTVQVGSQESLNISTIQYRGGLANYLQVITAQTSLLQSQRANVDVRTRSLTASVSLIQALGGGWDESQLPTVSEVRR